MPEPTTSARPTSETETIRLSPGVFVTIIDDVALLFDAVAQRAHVLTGLDAWVVTASQSSAITNLVADLVHETAVTEKDAAAAIEVTLGELGRLGLIGRAEPFE